MKTADYFWLGAFGALALVEVFTKHKLTYTFRRALRTDTKIGALAFNIGWPLLASRVHKHVIKGGW